MKYFVERFVKIETLATELNSLDISEVERHHLADLIDSSLHHVILDEILSNLTEEDKKLFLKKLHQGEEKELLDFLVKRVDNIEDKIKKVGDDLVAELHQDIREVKRKG